MGGIGQVGRTGGEGGVLALGNDRGERGVAAPDEEQALTGTGVEQEAALGRGEIEVASQGVGALGRLAEQDPDVALLDDRLAVVGAEELGIVLGGQLEPGGARGACGVLITVYPDYPPVDEPLPCAGVARPGSSRPCDLRRLRNSA